jgi:hypothetical protein
MLSHPTKHAYNTEYIQLGIEALETMVHDDPVSTALSSVRRILRAVEAAIGVGPALTNGTETTPQIPSMTKARAQGGRSFFDTAMGSGAVSVGTSNAAVPQMYLPNIQFPSMGQHAQQPGHAQQNGPSPSAVSEQMILFSDLLAGRSGADALATDGAMGPDAMALDGTAGAGFGADWPGLANLQFDVMTTDLYSFFPVDMTTPPDAQPAFGGGPAGAEGSPATVQQRGGWTGL